MQISNVSTGQRTTQVQNSMSINGSPDATERKRNPEEFVQRGNKSISEEEVIGLIEKANKDFIIYDRRFEFSIHEKTKQIMVKVIDVTTDEVIRELPPEKILDIVASMWEVAGIIVDKKI
ncbi:flagellar protein FlaG [Tissierella pigra]|uniref:Flagellar protein FlaG n=1 Tax=Tissierella pigra TaxID=2607614 RepID=A0A6N7Y1I3_9FIRM|nr:flagellar protein FlaG [Tissierella pigra]MBU5427775.1 flagellar protein FlaG [Tissierella pigra]MSU02694.1 flagellar protein FlaG [Tissierella pigra]